MLYGYISVCNFSFNLSYDCTDWWFPPGVYSSINRTPRNAVNITHSALKGYTVMMYLFGFVLGGINIVAILIGLSLLKDKKGSITRLFFTLLIAIPAPFLILGPFFSPWIALSLAQKVFDPYHP